MDDDDDDDGATLMIMVMIFDTIHSLCNQQQHTHTGDHKNSR